ncbi:MAG: hypothetical protein FJX91_08400 [Bacteroidetes bacterium]|nr:hypothetical protein [Bacteroidota bacterium]
MKTLNAEELHNLMTSFAKTRMVSVYVLFGIIAAYMKSVYQSAVLQVIGIVSIAVGLMMYL